jgi:hypothetical protein
MILLESERNFEQLRQELLSAKNDILEEQTANLNLQQRNSELAIDQENLK